MNLTDDALAYATCQRARWRCEVCTIMHGTRFMGGKGFYQVALSVDPRARKPRALCQRCWINATAEMPIAFLGQLPRCRRVKLVRLRLCQSATKEPVQPASSAAWLL